MLYSTGQIGEAEEMFVRALKHLNRRLPRTRLAAALKLTLERLKSRFYASTTFRTPGSVPRPAWTQAVPCRQVKQLHVIHSAAACIHSNIQIVRIEITIST